MQLDTRSALLTMPPRALSQRSLSPRPTTNHRLTIEEEGMPVHEMSSQQGKLHVEMNVVFPHSLTEEQKATLREVLP